MFGELSPYILIPGLVLLFVIVALIWRSQFSAEARLQRRRRKNYGPTVSRAKGPAVKLAVKTDDPRE